MNEPFTYDSEKIVFEILNEELVLVNLENGYYYIMQGSAIDIWQILSSGHTLADLLNALNNRYPNYVERIEKCVPSFVDQLKEERLLQPSSGPLQATTVELATHQTSFIEPGMFRYTDMASLIQMDPIQDFDEKGWPKLRTFSSSESK
jgi:Coenzyme PQQ synthesis protein D (PqqD)